MSYGQCGRIPYISLKRIEPTLTREKSWETKEKKRCDLLVEGLLREASRGDWIRTSDLLNSIHEAASKKGRFSEPFRNRRFPGIANFTRIVPLGQDFYCPY